MSADESLFDATTLIAKRDFNVHVKIALQLRAHIDVHINNEKHPVLRGRWTDVPSEATNSDGESLHDLYHDKCIVFESPDTTTPRFAAGFKIELYFHEEDGKLTLAIHNPANALSTSETLDLESGSIEIDPCPTVKGTDRDGTKHRAEMFSPNPQGVGQVKVTQKKGSNVASETFVRKLRKFPLCSRWILNGRAPRGFNILTFVIVAALPEIYFQYDQYTAPTFFKRLILGLLDEDHERLVSAQRRRTAQERSHQPILPKHAKLIEKVRQARARGGF